MNAGWIGRLLAEADVAVVVPPLLLLLVALAALDGAAGVPVVVSDMMRGVSRIWRDFIAGEEYL